VLAKALNADGITGALWCSFANTLKALIANGADIPVIAFCVRGRGDGIRAFTCLGVARAGQMALVKGHTRLEWTGITEAAFAFVADRAGLPILAIGPIR